MRNVAIHKSRSSEEWATPQSFFDALNNEFHFDIDACASPRNAKCRIFYSKQDDGLSKIWSGVIFMNPPFYDVDRWVTKAVLSARHGATVVCLLPSRTDTHWWHEFYAEAEIRWIRGRLKFDGKTNAPFSCCIWILRP